MANPPFPPPIEALPEADISFPGIRGWPRTGPVATRGSLWKHAVSSLGTLSLAGKIPTSPDTVRKGPVRGWLLASPQGQVVFMDIAPIGEVPPHAHGAQWGIVVEGEMVLTIGSETRTYRKGDSYYIPAGTVHSARFNSRVLVVDFFADPDRYRPKT